MFSADNHSEFYEDDFYTHYNTNMKPTTSGTSQPRLSLDSGLGLTNDSFYSSDLNESQLMDLSAATASDALPPAKLECSPPTKWARIRTPPSRKKKRGCAEVKEEQFPPGVSLFSTPSQKRIKMSMSSPTNPMKTPESMRRSIRISSPSPFKVTFSKTPLKLSNNENVSGFHIGSSGAYYDKKMTGSASKRCLLAPRPDGFTVLGSPNSDVLDVPLQTSFEGFGELPTETPSKIIESLRNGDDSMDSMDYHQYAGMIETSSSSVKEKSVSRNLLKTNSFAIVTHHPLSPKKIKMEPAEEEEVVVSRPPVRKQVIPKKESVKSAILKETNAKEMMAWKATPFETPKKELPLFSGRWLVISTGNTQAQQSLLSDARRFFRTHRPSVANPTIPVATAARSQKLPTIARVTLFKHRYRSLLV